MDSLEFPKLQTYISEYGIQGISTTGSLKTVGTELVEYMSYLVWVHDVRWDKGGMTYTQTSTHFCGSGIQNNQLRGGAGHVACIGVKRST
jgi:hypothetical protein